MEDQIITKFCPKCKTTKDITEYYKNRSKRGSLLGVQSYCKPCQYSRNRQYLKTPKGRAMFTAARHRTYQKRGKSKHLENTYGITLTEKEHLLATQGGVCGICKKNESNVRWCVDHDHSTGKIRGILCNGCNAGLGALGDSEESIYRALEYVRA